MPDGATDAAPDSPEALRAAFAFLCRAGWVLGLIRPEQVAFLAAGEYNANYLVTAPSGRCVLRVNHGSQLGLEDQISYEFEVLQALAGSGVTPRPHAVDPAPAELSGGALLMEYLEGRPLRYETDAPQAASVFAAVHSQPVPEGLVVQADPVRDIVAECEWLLDRYPDHPRTAEKARLLRYRDELLELAARHVGLFDDEPMCIVNTEVNSHNFILGERAWLVDWEKAVVSCRYQDLGHFLVPTTTCWKTDFVFDTQARAAFLSDYQRALGVPLEGVSLKTEVLERTILLRALSWSYMAWYEYTRPGRTLTNKVTFARITEYLDDMAAILG